MCKEEDDFMLSKSLPIAIPTMANKPRRAAPPPQEGAGDAPKDPAAVEEGEPFQPPHSLVPDDEFSAREKVVPVG